MKKMLKMVILLSATILAFGLDVMAQIRCTAIIPRLSGGVLVNVPANTNIPNGSVLAFPWEATQSIGGISVTQRTFNVTGLPPFSNQFQWSLQGDIKNATPLVNTTSITIGNSNFLLRPVNGGQSVNDRAQSKGRLTFSYTYTPSDSITGDTCVGPGIRRIRASISIDLLKKIIYTTIPTVVGNTSVSPITGPNCLQPLTLYTYSVEATMQDNPFIGIGIDRYKWDFSEITGATLQYNSSDNSSITIRTGSTVPANANLYCYFGEVNTPEALGQLATNRSGCGFASLRLQSGIGTPVVSMAATGVTTTNMSLTGPNCLPMPLPSSGTSVTFTVTNPGSLAYDWEFGQLGEGPSAPSNGWSASNPVPAAATFPYKVVGNNTITITNINNQPGTLILTVRNGCGGPQRFVYTIQRNAPTQVSGLLATNGTCLVTPNPFTASWLPTSNASLNNFRWTTVSPTAGWTSLPTPLGTASSILTNANTTLGAYTFALQVGTCAATQNYTINVRPNSITPPGSICAPLGVASPGVAVFTPVASTGYSYTLTGIGNSVSNLSTTNSPTISRQGPPTNPPAENGTITATYTAAAGCIATSPAVQITSGSVVPATITMPTCVGNQLPGLTANITIGNYPGNGTYRVEWLNTGGPSILGSGAVPVSTTGQLTPTGSINAGVIAVPIYNGISPLVSNYRIYHTAGTGASCAASAASASVTLPKNNEGPALTDFTFPPNLVIGSSTAGGIITISEANTWGYSSGIINTGSNGWYFTTGCTVGGSYSATTNVPINSIATNSISLNPNASANVTFGLQGRQQSNGCLYRVCRPISGWQASRQAVDQNYKQNALPATYGKVYPNPNNGHFLIEMKEIDENCRVEVMDQTGKEVLNEALKLGENEIGEKALPSGTYLVRILLKDKYYLEKIVVNN